MPASIETERSVRAPEQPGEWAAKANAKNSPAACASRARADRTHAGILRHPDYRLNRGWLGLRLRTRKI